MPWLKHGTKVTHFHYWRRPGDPERRVIVKSTIIYVSLVSSLLGHRYEVMIDYPKNRRGQITSVHESSIIGKWR
jgi:hypothetical protein